MIKNNKNLIVYITCAILLFIAFIIRLYRIDYPIADWHSWRQADTASVTRIFVRDGINLFYPRYYDVSSIQSGLFNPNGYRFVEFPVYNALTAFLYTTIGSAFSLEVTSRLVSILFTFVSAVFLYLIGKRFLGTLGGCLAAFYFLYLPFNIYYSRTILPEPTILAFLLASIWFSVRMSDTGNKTYFALSAILFSISLTLKPYVIFYVFIHIFLIMQKNGFEKLTKTLKTSGLNLFAFLKLNKKTFVEITMYLIISALPLLFWRLWAGRFPEGTPFYAWALNGNGIRFKPSYWKWIYGERVGHLLLGSWGLVIVAFGLVKKYRKNLFNQLFILSAVLYLTVVASANVLHDYYQILILPPLAFALAQGTMVMWNLDRKNKFLRRGLLIFSIAIMFITSGFAIKEYYNVNKWEIVEAGKFVDENTPKDAIVIAPYNGDTAFLYQTKRFGWPYRDRSFEELISRGADYFVSIDLSDPQTLEAESKYKVMEKNSRFVLIDLHTGK